MFNFKHIKGDLLGGLTAGIVALPLALAFGASTELGPSAGLYGAIFVSFFAALFGGTSTQISGPTAPMTAISMVLIAGIMANHDSDTTIALPIILSVFFLAGIFQIGLGFIGLGKYIKYIPYPVVSGFMTAIGILILLAQIGPTLGYNVKEDLDYVNQFKPQAEELILENILKDEAGEGLLVLEDFHKTINKAHLITEEQILAESQTLAKESASGVFGTFRVMPHMIKHIKWLEVGLALGTIFLIYGFKRITKKIPSTLVALVIMTSIAIGFKLGYKSIEEIPMGLPIPHIEMFTSFSLSSIAPYIFTALTLALLGSIDSLLTSVVADNMTKTKHNPNKELIGQGVGNSIASIFGGLPGAGATIRTMVNINAGGKTRLSGMISGVLLVIILLALAPIASQIPAAVLAGILITVGIGVMDYKGLKAIPVIPRNEVAIMLIVMILSVTWDLIYAVGIGLVIASLMFMKKIGDLTTEKSLVKSLAEDQEWKDEADFPNELKEEVYIKHVNGPLFFGSTADFQLLSDQIPKTAEVVIIRMDKSRYMDQSGLFTMEDVISELLKKDVKVLFVHLNQQPKLMMENIDIIPDLVSEDLIFNDFRFALKWIKNNVKNKY